MIRKTTTKYTFDFPSDGQEMLRAEILTMAIQLGKMVEGAGVADVGISGTADHVVVKVNEIDTA